MTVEWEGARVPLTALATHGRSPDRVTRERIMRGFLETFIERRGDLSALFDDLYAVRQQMARSAGFDSFVDFTYRAQSRPYSPGDARALHDAIERHVVPAMTRR